MQRYQAVFDKKTTKMKKLLILSLVMLMATVTELTAQKMPGVDKSPADIAYFRGEDGSPLVKVIYSRPMKKGRDIFGSLEPYGKVWRTGANEATQIRLYKDAVVGGKKVDAGEYTLFTIPNKDKWTIILNSELDQWGAYRYQENKDVIRTEVSAGAAPEEIEAFTITFKKVDKGTHLILAWDKTMVEVPIEM